MDMVLREAPFELDQCGDWWEHKNLPRGPPQIWGLSLSLSELQPHLHTVTVNGKASIKVNRHGLVLASWPDVVANSRLEFLYR